MKSQFTPLVDLSSHLGINNIPTYFDYENTFLHAHFYEMFNFIDE